MISEIARAAGIHVSQLFRWRRELCRIEEPRFDTAALVPVIVSEAASAVSPAQPEPPTKFHPHRKRSDVTIELGRKLIKSADPRSASSPLRRSH